MHQKTTPKLLILAGSSIALGSLSYTIARWLTPALFPYWGSFLLILLGLWSASSVQLLLRETARSLRSLALGLITAVLIIGCSQPWGGLAGVLFIVLAIALLLLITLLMGLLLWFRVAPSPRWLLLGFVPLLIGTLMMGIVNLKPIPITSSTQALSVSDELRSLYEMDQHDRFTGRFILDATRDQTRLDRLLTLDRQQQITNPEAQYHAAMLLQHGTCAQHFKRAYELATAAANANIPNAQSLAHASYDRWMLSIHQPQKYNTQLFLWQQPSCT
ncbi:MAG TPA: hypothetical protein V6D14_15415 [Coleofasciculaceae cyanobacterium]